MTDRFKPDERETPGKANESPVHDSDLFANYDPQAVIDALEATAGSWADLDTDEMIEELYRAREEGSRHVHRGYDAGHVEDELVARVGKDRRVTVPRAIRDHLGLQPGDEVVFTMDSSNPTLVRISRRPAVASLAGKAGKLPEPKSMEEMLDIARENIRR
ncbi:MAG: AbrB/MazE/SpoVT family DNA-binding domain-containing protein [Nitrolancea sp.]